MGWFPHHLNNFFNISLNYFNLFLTVTLRYFPTPDILFSTIDYPLLPLIPISLHYCTTYTHQTNSFAIICQNTHIPFKNGTLANKRLKWYLSMLYSEKVS